MLQRKGRKVGGVYEVAPHAELFEQTAQHVKVTIGRMHLDGCGLGQPALDHFSGLGYRKGGAKDVPARGDAHEGEERDPREPHRLVSAKRPFHPGARDAVVTIILVDGRQ